MSSINDKYCSFCLYNLLFYIILEWEYEQNLTDFSQVDTANQIISWKLSLSL